MSTDDGSKENKVVKTPWTAVDKRVYDKLPAEDFKIVADARRAMWSGGFSGLAVGGSCGAVAFAASNRGLALPWLKQKHLLLFILGGAALGSYVGTSMAAQDARHSVGTVFEGISTPPDSYRGKSLRARREAEAAEARQGETLSKALAASAQSSKPALDDDAAPPSRTVR